MLACYRSYTPISLPLILLLLTLALLLLFPSKCVDAFSFSVIIGETNVPSKFDQDSPPNSKCKFSVRHSPDRGRYAVASSSLLAGDTVYVERAYSSALYPDRMGSHCSNCLARTDSPVPCTNCSGVVFCSFACRDRAQDTFHRYECRYSEALTGFGCSQVAR